MFRKVLVANRGEIAVRILRGLREMGIAGAAVYSEADREALHVRAAREAVAIGPAPSAESYLNAGRILEAARRCGADAIHPGYGFLSENADFAAACQEAGLCFIGPPPEAIRRLGSKIEARRLAVEAGVPVVPGAGDPLTNVEQARAIAGRLGYPVLLKAAVGGGGKGMRRVDSESELEAAMRDAASEAERAFRSGELYMEKLVEEPRHIEIQIFGDAHGNLIHFGERECSLQRRHQKVIEECPSPLIARHPELRQAMGEAALRVARAAGYTNAGTAEFLVDKHRNFYFLEMNTRLQVEHPVTELATGRDLVHMQVRAAAGEPLGMAQSDVRWSGSAIECRIYAEDPDSGFLPSPGRIRQLREPAGPGIRVDSGVYAGWNVPLDYDPMLAKLIAWGETRAAAAARLRGALEEYVVLGIRNNISYFREILNDSEFLEGRLHTGFLESFEKRRRAGEDEPGLAKWAALAALRYERDRTPAAAAAATARRRWAAAGREEMMR